MSAQDYKWNYDYARLAWDSGFTFQTRRLRPSLDQNIGNIDVDQVVRERDVVTIEKNITTVIDFSLDNDQTSILDPTFVKVFRLSQLSVQYLLFCKKYLDNTLTLIKTEYVRNQQESNNLKHYITELEQHLASSKQKVAELKTALSCQIASAHNRPVYQCSECPKAFSTEEYLLAHIKRRHSSTKSGESSVSSFQAETDKLQMEIKELKERLNNTEKFIHHEESPRVVVPLSNMSSKTNTPENALLADLQQKFEFLKVHVENELRLLNTQKFDQEKYEKWFETFLNKLEQLHSNRDVGINANSYENVTSAVSGEKDLERNKHSQLNIVERVNLHDAKTNDSTTQTDVATHSSENVVCVSCQNKHFPIIMEQSTKQSSSSDEEYIRQKIQSETENQLEKFEEMIDNKITGSIEKLGNQMQSFWDKMNEIEMHKLQAAVEPVVKQQRSTKPNITHKIINTKNQNIQRSRKKTAGPKKTTKAIQQPNQLDVKITPSPREIRNLTLKKPQKIPSQEIIVVKETNISLSSEDETESESSEESMSSESSEEEEEIKSNDSNVKDVFISSKPSNTSTLGKRSLTSLKEAAFTSQVLEALQKEVEYILNSRLEEIGISSEWTSLPLRSYKRAIGIIEQQANVLHKDIPNYTHIRSRIIKNVDQQALEKKRLNVSPHATSRLKNLLNNVKNKAKGIIQNDVKPSSHKLKLQKPSASTLRTEQRPAKQEKPNPKMYATDSESESLSIKSRKTWNAPKPLQQTQKAYHDVIRELTTVNSKMKNQDDTISEISEAIPIPKERKSKIHTEDNNNIPIRTEMQAKSALRNYPSVGSLHKKKVIFDLDSSRSDQKNAENSLIVNKVNDGGSTTSIASSVLDGPKNNLTQKKVDNKQSELSDTISDWDLSEVLN